MKFKKQYTTLAILATLMFSIYVLVPGAYYFNAHSNSNFSPHDVGLKSSTEYNPAGIYDWSNFTAFTYRIPLEINSTFIDRTDYSVKIEVNFTQALEEAGYPGQEFDEDSVRVVEYEGNNPYYPKLYNASELVQMNKYILPSRFIPLVKYDDYDATTNAIGQLWFEMPGIFGANSNRTYMIYFDTIENTGGTLVTPESLIWNKDYNRNTDVIGDKMYHLAYGSYQETAGTNRGALTIWNEDLSDTLFHGLPHSDIQRYLYPIPGDFMGDGNVELLVCDRDNQFWLMDYNPQTGLFYSMPTVNGDPLNFDTVLTDYFEPILGARINRWYHPSVFAADMDHDGADEIIANTYDSGYNYIIIYNITQDQDLNHVLQVQEYIDTNITSVDPIDIQPMALADFDGNGYMDIVGADNDGGAYEVYGYTLYFWMNNGTGEYEHFNVTQAVHLGNGGELPREVRCISAGDIDNDGNIEIVTTDDDNYHYLYIWQWNETDQMEYEGTYDVPTDPNFREPVVGAMYDWDYDGYTEIIIGNSDTSGNSSIAVIEIKGDENTPDRIDQEDEWGQYGNTSIQYHNLYYPLFGDVDNDGLMEMSVGSYRKWDVINIYEPSVLVWNTYDTTPEWISPPAYNTIGGGGLGYQTMMNVFGAWDSYVCRQEPLSTVYSGKAKSPDLTIHILDMDHGPVSGAKVSITRLGIYTETHTTDQSGKANFELLNDATYDVEVNYSTPYYPEQTVYTDTVVINSATQLYTEETYITPLQKVYFNVTDSSGGDFTAGNLIIWDAEPEGTYGDIISMGVEYEEFTWLAEPFINTSVQYSNPYYNMVSQYVLNSTITPDGNATDSDTFDNAAIINMGGNDYQYIFDFDEQDSLLNWLFVEIDISGATHYINSIEIQLVFDVGQDQVYYEEISGTSTDTWTGNVSLWADSAGQLRLESLRSNHVRVIVNAHNTTLNTGSIDVDLYYQALEDLVVPFREVELEFIDSLDEAAEGFLIEVYETVLNRANNATLVNLTTNEFGEAYDLDGNLFYYFDDTASAEINYSIRAKFYKNYFNFEPNADDHANFTNDGTISYQFKIDINIGSIEYETNITVINPLVTNIDYDQDWDALIYLTATDVGAPFAIEAYPTISVYSVKTNTLVYQEDMVSNGTLGYYELSFNPQSDGITLGGDDYSYYIIIEAATPGYGSGPEDVVSPLTINPISTSYIANELEIWTWTDVATFSIRYLDRNSDPISDGIVTYDAPWLFDTVTVPESATPGNYTVSIDTTDPGNVGDYILKFTAYKDNYLQQEFDVRLSIRPLATTLNDNDPNDFLFSYVTPDVNLTQSYLIYFDYAVASSGNGITGATATCTVEYELIDSSTGFESVVIDEVGDGVYVLDYNTEVREEGTYKFDIKFEKLNHDAKVASITMNMVKNQFVYSISDGVVQNNLLKYTVENGEDQVITIDLRQRLDGSSALNAVVQYNGVDFTHDGNGLYTYIIKSGEVNTFISKGLVEGTITISQATYESITITVQVEVKMHSLFAGIPTFYLLLAIAFVVVGVGAIVLTKAVQNARIPEFVKKCYAVAKELSKKKTIDTRTSVVPSKIDTLIGLFGKDWEEINLDFRESIGQTASGKNKTKTEYTDTQEEEL